MNFFFQLQWVWLWFLLLHMPWFECAFLHLSNVLCYLDSLLSNMVSSEHFPILPVKITFNVGTFLGPYIYSSGAAFSLSQARSERHLIYILSFYILSPQRQRKVVQSIMYLPIRFNLLVVIRKVIVISLLFLRK